MDLYLTTFFSEAAKMGFLKESCDSLSAGVFYMIFVVFLTSGFLLLGFCLGQKWRYEISKLTAFECGFDPLSSSRMPFSMRFFLVALLFLLFDMEMVLLFPYIFSLKVVFLQMSLYSKVNSLIFLLILFFGLFHEMNEGSLEWKY